MPVTDARVAQLLASRRLHPGLHPNAPSPDGVLKRVVERFEIHLSR